MSSSTADAQVVLLELNPTLSPLVELAGVCRIGSSSPRRRGKPLGEPPPFPKPARVPSLSTMAGGRRRPRAIDPDLIGRLRRSLPIRRLWALIGGPSLSASSNESLTRCGRDLGRPSLAGLGPFCSSPISFLERIC
jgi:hypothetical protein